MRRDEIIERLAEILAIDSPEEAATELNYLAAFADQRGLPELAAEIRASLRKDRNTHV